MSKIERKIRSIPPHTMMYPSVALRPITIGIGRGLGNASRIPQRGARAEAAPDWNVEKYVYHKPQKREKPRHPFLYQEDGRITWSAEIVEDYDIAGDLGVILEFAGIKGLTRVSFLRGRRDYGPDTTVFYSQIRYQGKKALLMLATIGDILESQVVPNQKDIAPFFQDELYLPQLMMTHDPASMAVRQHNGLITVSYSPQDSRII